MPFFAAAWVALLMLSASAAPISGNVVVLVNSQSPRYLDFQHFIQPYLDNFGFPYVVQDISTNAPDDTITNCAEIIIGHADLDTNLAYLTAGAQTSLWLAVSNGTGLVNFDNDLSSGGAPRYQFIQTIFGFSYGSSATATNVSLPPTETGAQMQYITALHPTNDAIAFRSSITLPRITAPAGATTLAWSGTNAFLSVGKFGQGRAVQWSSYDWMVSTVLGPLDGLDDLIWRGVVWSARKPFVMRGMPNLVSMRIDDSNGPFWWAHLANQVGFKPYMTIFIDYILAADTADLRQMVTNGDATASIHSFASSTMFYFDHQNETEYSDVVQSNNFYVGTQWQLDNGIPISKVCAAHYSELGTNAFAGLKAWGMEFVPIEVVPGTVEYAAPYAPWLAAGPYRLYETPQQGQVNLPTFYADWLTVPGHPEYSNTFFDAYCEVRDVASCGEWCPDNDVADTITRGTTILKRDLDSMAMATLFTHEWYIHPTPCCSEGAAITTNNFMAELEGITNNLAAYNPIYVTLDYASQYMRATRTSRLIGSAVDSASGVVSAIFSGKTDLDLSIYIFTGADSAITFTMATVPAFSTATSNTVLLTGPPIISVPPSSQTNNAGTLATFTVGATGSPPFTYQWLRNGTNALTDGGKITGSTNATLQIGPVLGADAASFSVIVANAFGSATSAPAAVLTVIDPVITNQPASLSVLPGATATFTVGAAATAPAYQWLRGGAPIGGATAATLTLTNVSFDDATNYSVVVSNYFGSATSSNAILNVIDMPVANNASYSLGVGATLSVSPPGVLANDVDGAGEALSALLVSPPIHGTLKLAFDGEFIYAPDTSYVGPDAFTYSAANAQTSSVPAVVSLSITSDVAFFQDDFSRTTDPGPLSPWIVESGNWTVTGGALPGGTNALQSYGFAYLTNTYTNYAVEARIQFSSISAWGGGIGGRLNPATGAHYAAWIYPEASPGGSNLLRLVKFQNWSGFGYESVPGAAMQTASLAQVGTNWHTLKLAFHDSRIAVYFDGAQMMSVPDSEATTYASGGITADFWTSSTPYYMSVGDVIVRALAVNDNFAVTEDFSLIVPAPGVLTNDTAVYGTNLTAALATAPAHGVASVNPNGGFTYIPANGFVGTDSFTYNAGDGSNLLGAATVTVTVVAPESPMIIASPSNLTTNAGATVVLAAVVAGSPPVAYQWFLNGTNQLADNSKITGSTTATLTISNVLGGDAGYYALVVSNAFGGATSSPPAQLVVNDPVITSQPSNSTNIPGTTANFAVGAYGTTPQYQWLKAGVPIPNATATNLTLQSVSATDAANYSVVVSNVYGNLTSQIAQLVLVPQPTIVSLNQTNGVVTITWDSFPGQTYRLQYRNSLTDPIWHDVPPDIVATGYVTSVTTSYGNLSQRLYRVLLVQPMLSPLVITSFVESNGIVTATWNSVFGQNYRLQFKNRVQDKWRDLLPGVTAAGTTAAATDAPGGALARYYRVAVGQGTAPPPKIQSLRLATNTASVAWYSIAGQTYRLQYKQTVTDASWQTVLPDYVAGGTLTIGTDAIGTANQRFYRVVLLP